MKIGIVGSNDRAVAIARLFASGGHEVTLGDATPAGDQAAQQAGVPAELPYDQATKCSIVVFATPWEATERAVTAMGSGAHPVIVDATEGKTPGGPTSAECLSKMTDSHDVVRALIVLPQAGANVPICGDDEQAKAAVDQALQACGCVTTDRGNLASAAELEPPAEPMVTRGEVAPSRTLKPAV